MSKINKLCYYFSGHKVLVSQGIFLPCTAFEIPIRTASGPAVLNWVFNNPSAERCIWDMVYTMEYNMLCGCLYCMFATLGKWRDGCLIAVCFWGWFIGISLYVSSTLYLLYNIYKLLYSILYYDKLFYSIL